MNGNMLAAVLAHYGGGRSGAHAHLPLQTHTYTDAYFLSLQVSECDCSSNVIKVPFQRDPDGRLAFVQAERATYALRRGSAGR